MWCPYLQAGPGRRGRAPLARPVPSALGCPPAPSPPCQRGKTCTHRHPSAPIGARWCPATPPSCRPTAVSPPHPSHHPPNPATMLPRHQPIALPSCHPNATLPLCCHATPTPPPPPPSPRCHRPGAVTGARRGCSCGGSCRSVRCCAGSRWSRRWVLGTAAPPRRCCHSHRPATGTGTSRPWRVAAPRPPPGPCSIPIPCGTHRGQSGFGGQRGVGAAPAGAAEPQAPPHLLAQHHAEEEDEGALGWRGGHVGMAWGGCASQPPSAHCRGPHRHHRQIKGPPMPTGCPPLAPWTG